MKKMRALAALCLVNLAASVARAAPVVYTDLPTFEAANPGSTDVPFTGIVPTSTSFVDFPTPPGITVSGVNFDIANPLPGDSLNVTGKDYYGPNTYPADFLVPSSSSRPTTDEVISLPAAATAVGLELGTQFGSGFTIDFSNGDQYVGAGSPALGAVEFLGFRTSSPVTSLTIATSGDVVFLSDFRYAAVPEPAGVTLAGIGSACLLLTRRRRPRLTSPPAA